MLSSKNTPISSATAATDLGLGDALKNQVEGEIAARKKKLLQQQATQGGQQALGPATQSLFAGGTNG